MTGEEMERAIAFLIEHDTKFSANMDKLTADIQELKAAQATTTAHIQSLTEAQEKRAQSLEISMQSLAEAQEKRAQSLEISMQSLAEAQEKRTQSLEISMQSLAEAQEKRAQSLEISMQSLAEAQEKRTQSLEISMQSLAEAQEKRTQSLEISMQSLAEAQEKRAQSLETSMQSLAEAQEKRNQSLAATQEQVNGSIRVLTETVVDLAESVSRLETRMDETNQTVQNIIEEMRDGFNKLILANEATRDLAEKAAQLAINTSQRVTNIENKLQ